MPIVDIHLIEGVFDKNQKQEMIRKVTDAMVDVEGETMRGVTWVRLYEVASGEWGMGGKGITTADVKAMQTREPPPAAWMSHHKCRYLGCRSPPLGHPGQAKREPLRIARKCRSVARAAILLRCRGSWAASGLQCKTEFPSAKAARCATGSRFGAAPCP